LTRPKPHVQAYRANLKAKARKLYVETGMSGPEIAKLLDVNKSTVYGYLSAKPRVTRRRGETARQRGKLRNVPHDEIERTAFLYRAPPNGLGYSSTEVAETLGITHDTVLYRLEHAGVERRTRAESARLRYARKPRAKPGNGKPRDKGVHNGR
jgi:DNA-binding CsgD family transcriptional regulator